MATPRKKKPGQTPGQTPGKRTFYVELPAHLAHLKADMEVLARLHNRKLTGEVIQAIQEYVTRHHAEGVGGTK
jgi:hypothetical protein